MEILDLNETPHWASGQAMETQASRELVWPPLGNELAFILSGPCQPPLVCSIHFPACRPADLWDLVVSSSPNHLGHPSRLTA